MSNSSSHLYEMFVFKRFSPKPNILIEDVPVTATHILNGCSHYKCEKCQFDVCSKRAFASIKFTVVEGKKQPEAVPGFQSPENPPPHGTVVDNAALLGHFKLLWAPVVNVSFAEK